MPERGIGTASSRRSTSMSLVTPSDCAWKFVSTRCRRTGCASARMSSKRHVIAAAGQRARLARQHQVLRGAHAAAERHPLLDRLRAGRRLRPARPHDRQRVAQHRVGHRHAPHEPLERHQVGAGHRPVELRLEDRGGRADDLQLLVLGRVVDDDVEHEAIELRFGQRIGAFELDRVLRREHVERLFELVGAALDGDAVFLHRLEQRRLRLRRRAVDLVGQHDVGEDRPGREHHRAPAGRPDPPG